MSVRRRLKWKLDLDTGEMNGLVLAGSFEGQELNALEEEDLLRLHSELFARCRKPGGYWRRILTAEWPDWRAGL